MKKSFDELIGPPDENGCCRYLGPYFDSVQEYGRYGEMLAHRYQFKRTHGYLPPVVRHTCDNPWCIAEAHLVPGTQRDNMQDREDRDRTKGSKRLSDKRLSDLDVKQLRTFYSGKWGQMQRAAEYYGVDYQQIYRALRGGSHTHLNKDYPPHRKKD